MLRALIVACMASSTLAVTIKSDPICNSAGCTQYLHPKDDTERVEYQDGGPLDEDIIASEKNLKSSENLLDHKWKIKEVFKGNYM